MILRYFQRHNIYLFFLTEEIAAAESALVLADYSNATKPIPKPPRIPKTSQSKPPAVAANVNPSSRPHTPVSNYKRDSPGWDLLDVLWCQPINLIHVVSTSEFHEY